jgi:hypothetical protein
MINGPVCKKLSGYCPHLEKENTIYAEYTEITICDSIALGYKLTSFKCPNKDECKLNHECPLWKIAIYSKP